jgi:Glycosyltransferase family 87
MTEGSAGTARARIARDFPLLTRVGFMSAWLLGVLAAFRAIQLGITEKNLGSDAHAYWLAGQVPELTYDRVPGQGDAFLYSPAFAHAISPFTSLPWTGFLALWIALETAVLVWLVRPLSLRWAIPLSLLCVPELVNGNVYLVLAGIAVAGLRYPALWVFPALTKVLPAVGLLWFAIRGEWHRVLEAILVATAVVACSYVVSPNAWRLWVEFLVDNRSGTREGSIIFAIRCVAGVGLLVVGARTGRPWTLAPVMVLVSPALALTTLTMLISLPRLLEVPSWPVGLSPRHCREALPVRGSVIPRTGFDTDRSEGA